MRAEWVQQVVNGWKAQEEIEDIPDEVLEVNQELKNHFNGHSRCDLAHSHHYVIYQLASSALKKDKIEMSQRALALLVQNLHERLYSAKRGIAKGFSFTVCREAVKYFRIRHFSKLVAKEKAKLRFATGSVRFKYGSTWKEILMIEGCDEQWRQWYA